MSELILKNEVYQIVGAAMEVHRQLGCGFLEAVYQEALAIEFRNRTIPFIKEQKLTISYKGIELEKYYYADFICYNQIIIELKALTNLCTEHEAQLLNYLKATGLRMGLLINFGSESLQYKRMIL